MYEVVSFDSKYYCTDGVIENVIYTTSSKEDADRKLESLRRQATKTPWTGFYIREKKEVNV